MKAFSNIAVLCFALALGLLISVPLHAQGTTGSTQSNDEYHSDINQDNTSSQSNPDFNTNTGTTNQSGSGITGQYGQDRPDSTTGGQDLPRTASLFPLIGLIGLVSLSAASIVHFARK